MLLLLGLLGGPEGGERSNRLAPTMAELPEPGDPRTVLVWRDVQVEADASEKLTWEAQGRTESALAKAGGTLA